MTTEEARSYPVVVHQNATAQKAIISDVGSVPLVCIDDQFFVVLQGPEGLVRTPLKHS